MKVKVLKEFKDLSEKGKTRKVNDEFEVTKERFEDVNKHGKYLEEVKVKTEPKKK